LLNTLDATDNLTATATIKINVSHNPVGCSVARSGITLYFDPVKCTAQY